MALNASNNSNLEQLALKGLMTASDGQRLRHQQITTADCRPCYVTRGLTSSPLEMGHIKNYPGAHREVLISRQDTKRNY